MMFLIDKAEKLATKPLKDVKFSKKGSKSGKKGKVKSYRPENDSTEPATERQNSGSSKGSRFNFLSKLRPRTNRESAEINNVSDEEALVSVIPKRPTSLKRPRSVDQLSQTSVPSLRRLNTISTPDIEMLEGWDMPSRQVSTLPGRLQAEDSGRNSPDSLATYSTSRSVKSTFRDSRQRLAVPNPEVRRQSPSNSFGPPSDNTYDSVSSRTSLTGSSYAIPSLADTDRRNLLPRTGYFWHVKIHLKLARNLPSPGPKRVIDPYVKVKYRRKTLRRTVIVFRNNSPVWDEAFGVPLTNLEYPMELRVYNRDAFRKDDYIGRVLVPLKGLVPGLVQEFTLRLEDETGRSVQPYIGELNFTMMLGEIPELQVSSDRRQSLHKQLKTDLQLTHQMAIPPVSSAASITSTACVSHKSSLANWCESVGNYAREWTLDTASNILNTTQFRSQFPLVEENDDDLVADEWIGSSEMFFFQPDWPPCFFEGTKVAYYTSGLVKRHEPVPFSHISRLPTLRTDIALDQLYTRSRLLVTLVRAENLAFKRTLESISPTLSRNRLLPNRNIEKAVLGRPLWNTEDKPPCPVAQLSVGKTTQRSFVAFETDKPSWNQEFEFRLKVGEKTVLQIDIMDTSTALQPLLLKAYLDFAKMLPDWTDCFTLNNTFANRDGHVIILATLTAFNGPSDITTPNIARRPAMPSAPDDRRTSDPLDDPVKVAPVQSRVSQEVLDQVAAHYNIMRSFGSRFDIGWLHVYVLHARDLASKDRNGKSDPYCTLRLVNRVAYTSTAFKTLDPVWNQAFVFPIGDIYDVLDIHVLDEDKEGFDFLGRIVIPLNTIIHKKRKWYALKDKHLVRRSKGAIFLEFHIVYNSFRAAVRAAYPRDHHLEWNPNKVKLRNFLWKYVPKLQQKIDRITPYALYMNKGTQLMHHLYKWENRLHSSLFLVATCMGILFVQPYMIAFGLVIGLSSSYVASLPFFRQLSSAKSPQPVAEVESDENDLDPELLENELDSDDYMDSQSDQEKVKNKKEKKKPLKTKLKKAREVMATLLNVVDGIASFTEKMDSLFRWDVPCLSASVLIMFLFLAILTFIIPLRYILILIFTKKFTKRLRQVSTYDASVISLILRIPDRIERLQYRMFRPTSCATTPSKVD